MSKDYSEIDVPSDIDYDKLHKDTDDFNKHVLRLSELEYYRFEKFREDHRHKDMNKGAIGGHISLTYTFTSIGSAKECKCDMCGETANITDYNW